MYLVFIVETLDVSRSEISVCIYIVTLLWFVILQETLVYIQLPSE